MKRYWFPTPGDRLTRHYAKQFPNAPGTSSPVPTPEGGNRERVLVRFQKLSTTTTLRNPRRVTL